MTNPNTLPNINTPEKPEKIGNSIQLHVEESSSKTQSKPSNEPKAKVQKIEPTFTRTCNFEIEIEKSKLAIYQPPPVSLPGLAIPPSTPQPATEPAAKLPKRKDPRVGHQIL